MSGARQLNVRYFTKFILRSVFSLIEAICSKTWKKSIAQVHFRYNSQLDDYIGRAMCQNNWRRIWQKQRNIKWERVLLLTKSR